MLSGNLRAQSGATTFQKIVGARSAGMAEAFSAVEDIDAWLYNPATLMGIDNPILSGTFSRGFASDYLSTLVYGQPTSIGTFSGSFSYYDTGNEELLASDGSVFKVHLQRDILCSVSYANMIKNLRFGITGKFLQSELAESSTASTLALDVGVLTHLYNSNILAGISLRNFGRGLKFIDERDSLPAEIRAGGSYLLPFMKDNSLLSLMALDIAYLLNDKEVIGKLGIEYRWEKKFSVRAGYHINSDVETAAFGFGVVWGRTEFNYAFGLNSDITDTHRFSINYLFSTNRQNSKKY